MDQKTGYGNKTSTGPDLDKITRLVVNKMCFDEEFVKATLRESPVLKRLAAADRRLADALENP